MGSLQTASAALCPEAAAASRLVRGEYRVQYNTYCEQANDGNYNGLLLKYMNGLLKLTTGLFEDFDKWLSDSDHDFRKNNNFKSTINQPSKCNPVYKSLKI
jgi:hypothetical protein